MKYLKITGILLLFLIIFFVVFYFWARRPLYCPCEYSGIFEFSNNPTDPIPDTFSVVTYNIGYLSGMTNNQAMDRPRSLLYENLHKAVDLFDKYDPEIIVFQEIDFKSSRTYDVNQHRELAIKTGYQQGAESINWDKQYVPFPYWPFKHHFGRMLSGQALLTHASILSNWRIVLPKPESNPFYYNDFYLDRLAQVAWLKTTRDSLLIINVHFEAWDSPTRELQADIVLDIIKEFENDHPIILMGDFNCTPPFAHNAYQETTIDVLLNNSSLNMVTKKVDYLKNPEIHFTFNSEKPHGKIDYIFYNSRYLKCLKANVLHEAGDISDHLPLWAVFTFENAP